MHLKGMPAVKRLLSARSVGASLQPSGIVWDGGCAPGKLDDVLAEAENAQDGKAKSMQGWISFSI